MTIAPITNTSAADDRAQYNAVLAGLIGHAARGDAKAFEELYNATSRWMLARVRRITGDSLAQDVLADVYLQVWRSLASFDAARGEPLAWLLTIARSRALDRLRLERTAHGGQWGAVPVPSEALEPSHSNGPQELLELAQECARVRLGMATLSPRERLVLALAYFGECTHNEIAAQTGFPLGSVKSLMSRSQQKLRAMFAPPTGTAQIVARQSASGRQLSPTP